tara:strand:- start:131 stop:436 length:306 start_codon:yes stop_codon:yes gene_type:complete
MKKYLVIFLIFFLILSTAMIKNSTKRIDDEIFTVKENIRTLNIDHGNIKLENDFLSSTEKLLEFQNSFFENELVKKNIKEIKIINKKLDKLEIKPLKFKND